MFQVHKLGNNYIYSLDSKYVINQNNRFGMIQFKYTNINNLERCLEKEEIINKKLNELKDGKFFIKGDKILLFSHETFYIRERGEMKKALLNYVIYILLTSE